MGSRVTWSRNPRVDVSGFGMQACRHMAATAKQRRNTPTERPGRPTLWAMPCVAEPIGWSLSPEPRGDCPERREARLRLVAGLREIEASHRARHDLHADLEPS